MSARTIVRVATLVVTATLVVACSGSDDAATSTIAPDATGVVGSPPVSTAPPGVVPTTIEDDQSIGPPDQDELNPPPLPRVCSLASTDEVGTVIGAEPMTSNESKLGGKLLCNFVDENNERMASIRILTAEYDPPPATEFAALAGSEGAEHVEGFGDDAVWAEDALQVSIGSEMVTFTIFPQETLENGEAIRSATLALAELAMPRYALHPPT